jgi:hypothetical protein
LSLVKAEALVGRRQGLAKPKNKLQLGYTLEAWFNVKAPFWERIGITCNFSMVVGRDYGNG